jgi:RNA methyltransferase, TrmH family
VATPLGARNPHVTQLRRLARRRSSRTEDGRFVIDGPVLVAEAHAAGVVLDAVFVDIEADATGAAVELGRRLAGEGVPVHLLSPGVLAGAVDPVTPNGIAAVAQRPVVTPNADRPVTAPLILVLAGVADPGNAGTLLRSSEAAGATAVWATTGTVDLFAPKTVRAAAGALFQVPVRDQLDAAHAGRELHDAGIRVLGTIAADGTPLDRADLTGPCALVLGNEAHGLDPAWHDTVDEWLTIPMVGRAESLNVAMAGTLLCFEAARQRRSAE